MASESSIYCICKQRYDPNLFMIQCDVCKDWFHGTCVNVKEYQAYDIESYHCPQCQVLHGSCIYKTRRNWHRHDYSEDGTNKALQTGTVAFIRELKKKSFLRSEEIPVIHLQGSELTWEYLMHNGFDKPILIDKKDGLGLTLPPASFTVNDVEHYIGSTKELDIIDVGRQEDHKMTMKDWVQYYNSPHDNKIYNVISLEFSDTRLNDLVESPAIVRQLSWMTTAWPDDLPYDCSYSRPAVQKYCLMGVKDSYTDFHIDFGGSTVWYHIFKGEKIFYLIPPTEENLNKYEEWFKSSNQSETFLADKVDKCYKCVVKQGQTIFLPSSWIHSVFTPIDSLVFGGNFLHDLAIEKQIRVYELERRVNTELKYLFPSFETSHWYKAQIIRDYIKDCNDTQKLPHRHLLEGGKVISSTLKSWMKRKDFSKRAKYDVPESINHSQLLQSLDSELRLYDAVSPEDSPRISKRTKKGTKRKKKTHHTSHVSDKDSPTKQGIKVKITQIKQHKKELNNKKSKRTRATPSLKVRICKPKSEDNKREMSQDSSQSTESGSPMKTRLKLKVSKGKIVNEKPTDLGLVTISKRRKRSDSTNKSKKPATKSPQSKSKKSKTMDAFDKSSDFEEKEKKHIVDIDDSLKSNKKSPRKKPTRKKPIAKSSPAKDGSLKLRLSLHGHSDKSDSTKAEQSTASESDAIKQDDSVLSSPDSKPVLKGTSAVKQESESRGALNGGIAEILKASGYGADNDVKENLLTQYVPSPSTHDAIQGMLSMRNNSLYDYQDEDEKLKSFYRDEEFIYPSLEMSDDENDSRRVGRTIGDSPWNPHAQVRVSVASRERIPRDSARRESVGGTLAITAAKLNDASTKEVVKAKSVKRKRLHHDKSSSGNRGSESVSPPSVLSMVPSTSQLENPVKRSLNSPSNQHKSKKPKKGFATAKQRLGRILKIHKMSF